MKANRLRDARGELADMLARSVPIIAPHVVDELAARYAADPDFTRDARGTHDGDSLTDGYDVNEGV